MAIHFSYVTSAQQMIGTVATVSISSLFLTASVSALSTQEAFASEQSPQTSQATAIYRISDIPELRIESDISEFDITDSDVSTRARDLGDSPITPAFGGGSDESIRSFRIVEEAINNSAEDLSPNENSNVLVIFRVDFPN